MIMRLSKEEAFVRRLAALTGSAMHVRSRRELPALEAFEEATNAGDALAAALRLLATEALAEAEYREAIRLSIAHVLDIPDPEAKPAQGTNPGGI